MADYQPTQSYSIWVLRIWQEGDTGDWRAVVNQSPGEHQHAFSAKETLIAFLDEAMAEVTSSDTLEATKAIELL